MTFPSGRQVYNCDTPPVTARGIAFSAAELDVILQNHVAALVYDQEGTDQIATLLASVPSTQFEIDGLSGILNVCGSVEDWRVGEALAESFLSQHCRCEFPWPTNRDLRNPNASPAGCDLVGFQQDRVVNGEPDFRFAFGEIKTSTEDNYPPNVASGRTSGLEKQIDDLIGDTEVKYGLVRYLAFHANGKAWLPKFEKSARRFFQDRNDVSLFGFIIRDVAYNALDLQARSRSLGAKHLSPALIELRAVYLPLAAIGTLAVAVTACRSTAS